MNYNIRVTEKRSVVVGVEAESMEQAVRRARDAWANCEFELPEPGEVEVEPSSLGWNDVRIDGEDL